MKDIIYYIKESRIDESFLGGLLFSVIAIAAAGLSSAVVSDIQSNIVKRRDKKLLYNKIKDNLSKEDIEEINNELEDTPELKNWSLWDSFIEMIENGERFGKITDKAKEVMNDSRYQFLPIRIQDGIKNIATA